MTDSKVADSSAGPAIVVRDVTFRYGDRVALDALSLDVPAGKVFGLLGPNGSGKTTLFRVLSTLSPVQAGSVVVDGLDVVTQRDAVRERLGVVFQSPALDVHLTALENLTHHGHLYGLRGAELRERAMASLAALGLAGRERERVKTFSGGMRRRVELAKGLLHRPRVLLLDEPSTGLDPAARIDLWTQLRSAVASLGVTMLLSTHLMDEAEKCDELAILSRGKRVAVGTPEGLKTAVGRQVIRLLAREPDGAAERLERVLGVAVTRGQPPYLRIEHGEPAALLPRVVEVLGGDLLELTLSRPTLEDVFLHHTGRVFHADEGEEKAPSGRARARRP